MPRCGAATHLVGGRVLMTGCIMSKTEDGVIKMNAMTTRNKAKLKRGRSCI